MSTFGKGARRWKPRSAGILARETCSLAIRGFAGLEELARNWEPVAVYTSVEVVTGH